MKLSLKSKVVFILVALFLVSVLVRIPHLNRPLGGYHEWLTATTLRVHRIWHEDGIANHYFAPIMTFNGDANKNIMNQAVYPDSLGNFYYVSYPPFGDIFPYLVFKGLGIYPDVVPLQVFNMVLHFISAFFVFLIISLLTKNSFKGKLNTPAIVGFALYLFTPSTLWFQSNVYAETMLVQPLFIMGIYFVCRLVLNKDSKWIDYLVFGILNFFMIYTEWIGVFFVFFVFLYALFHFKDKRMRKILYITVVTSVLALALTIWQYLLINDLIFFKDYVIGKYLLRSGLTSANDAHHLFRLGSWETIFSHYISSYLPLFLLFVVAFFLRPKSGFFSFTRNEKLVLYFCLLPVLLHQIVFFNFTIHDFALLKDAFFFVIFFVFLYLKLYKNKTLKLLILNIAIVLTIIGSIGQYSLIAYLTSNTIYNMLYKPIGEYIAATAKQDEVVFVDTGNPNVYVGPQAIFYAGRNVASWEGEESARELLKLNNSKRGVLYILNDVATRVKEVKYINL